MSEWVKCSDKLPEEGKDVLCVTSDKKEEIKIGRLWSSQDILIWLGDHYTLKDVIFWMPLPEKPNE